MWFLPSIPFFHLILFLAMCKNSLERRREEENSMEVEEQRKTKRGKLDVKFFPSPLMGNLKIPPSAFLWAKGGVTYAIRTIIHLFVAGSSKKERERERDWPPKIDTILHDGARLHVSKPRPYISHVKSNEHSRGKTKSPGERSSINPG